MLAAATARLRVLRRTGRKFQVPPTDLAASSRARPRYVAIIADGNNRWANRRGLPASAGHTAAADTLKACVTDALALGIHELAVYVFSTENWSRPASEVVELMSMFTERIEIEAPYLHQQGVRVHFLGRRDGLAADLIEQMDRVQLLTEGNDRMILFLAFNYGGRAEIIDAAKRFQGASEDDFRSCLYAADMHDPEVIIRTGGEQRLSNYLLWQSAYAELVFRDELWPEFSRATLEDSLLEFTDRARRFGGR
jgi:undecaprenyl diphosphate synthase